MVRIQIRWPDACQAIHLPAVESGCVLDCLIDAGFKLGDARGKTSDAALAVPLLSGSHGAVTVAEEMGDIDGVQSWALTPKS